MTGPKIEDLLLTRDIAIGVTTLQTATFEAKLVIKTVIAIRMKTMNKFGKLDRLVNAVPIFPFKSEYFALAAVDNANPPPETVSN